MKILAFIATFGINAAVGLVLFFFLILSLNGFHGNDAAWGINLYIALAFLTAILTGVLSIFAVGWLVDKKQMSSVAATLISIASFVVLGAVLDFVSVLAGIIMTSIKHGRF